MKKFKSLFFLFILLLISAIVYHNWFSWSVFTSSDWGFGYAETIKEYLSLHVWFSWSSFGFTNYLLWRTPITYLTGIIGNFGYNSNISDKFFVFIPTIVLANASVFYLIKKIIKSNTASFIGTIVFNYNTYLFVASTAFLLYAAGAWSILTLYIFIHALEKRKTYLFLFSGLTLFITGVYDFRVTYMSVFLLIFYFLFFSFFIQKFQTKIFFKNFLSFTLQGFVFTLLNIYWLLPIFNSHALTTNVILDRGLFGNEFLNILYSISLFHPFWAGNKIAIFNPQTVWFYFWLIPIFSFLGLYLNRKNKNILFFGLLAILGIFLTKQVGHPFPSIYPFLFEHLPGFNAFREASKFYSIIALGYSVLIAGFVGWIVRRQPKKRIIIFFKYFLIFLVPFIFIINTVPVFTGEFMNIYVPHQIKNDYLILKKKLLKDKDYSRVLWVPAFTRWGFLNNNHPQISVIYEIYNSWNYLIKEKQNPNIIFQAELIELLLSRNDVSNLLNMSSVKYVVIPLEDKYNEDDVFIFYGKNKNFYISLLDKLPFLKKINIGTKEVVVYENENFRPHVYATTQKETIKVLRPMIYDLRYKFVNPTEYMFSIKNVKNSFYLNFSESFHPQWNLRIGNFNWIDVLIKKNYFISDKYHFQNDATLNSYYLDPKIICQNFDCKKNSDGSYDISGTLYFAPQSYMYLGLIISGATLTAVVGYLFFVLGRNLYERKNK